MNTRTITTAICMAILAGAASPAIAGSGKGRFMEFFDTNHDNVVTMAEFQAEAANRFKRMDTDKSGIVSKDEYRDYMRQRKEERKHNGFARMDQDANGMVTRDEYLAYKQQHAERRFTRMDKDGDGVVSKEEFEACQKRKQNKHRMFDRIDANHDGQLTEQESLTAWGDWFKRIDANHDQVVNMDEVDAYRNRLHGSTAGGK